MKYIRSFLVFFFATAFCTAFGSENKYVFVGQNGDEGLATTVFVLEVLGDNLDQCVYINENGEMYLKADKIGIFSENQLSGPNSSSEKNSFARMLSSLLMSSINRDSWLGNGQFSSRENLMAYCPEGHPNPPWNLVCQICGKNLY